MTGTVETGVVVVTGMTWVNVDPSLVTTSVDEETEVCTITELEVDGGVETASVVLEVVADVDTTVVVS